MLGFHSTLVASSDKTSAFVVLMLRFWGWNGAGEGKVCRVLNFANLVLKILIEYSITFSLGCEKTLPYEQVTVPFRLRFVWNTISLVSKLRERITQELPAF